MIEPINHYMKVGIVHFMAFPETMKGEGPILETVESIARDPYFEAIELTWIKDDAVRATVAKRLQTAGMTVAYGAQPRLLTTGMNINDLDETRRLAAVASLKTGMDEAVELGATGFAFLSGHYEEARLEEAMAALASSTRELCRYAQEKGDLTVALEVFDYDIDKKSLIGPADRARRFAEMIRPEYDHFGLMIDLSHIPMIHETNDEHILPLQPYLVHAHMGNTVIADPSYEAYGDTHPRFGFPNSENDVPQLTAYLQKLKDIGFIHPEKRPIVSFEVKPWGDETPDMVIANAKRTLNQAWRQVR